MEDVETEKTKKLRVKQKTKVWMIIIILILIGAGAWFIYTKTTGLSIDDQAQPYEVAIERPSDWESNRIAIPGYGPIQIQADQDLVDVALFNPDENPCYFQFDVLLEEGEELLYESNLVKPGTAITSIKLNRTLSEGEYPIIIRINTYDLKDGKTPMNGSEVKTKLVTYNQE